MFETTSIGEDPDLITEKSKAAEKSDNSIRKSQHESQTPDEEKSPETLKSISLSADKLKTVPKNAKFAEFNEFTLYNHRHSKLTRFKHLSFRTNIFNYHEDGHPAGDPWDRVHGVRLPTIIFKNPNIIVEEFKFITDVVLKSINYVYDDNGGDSDDDDDDTSSDEEDSSDDKDENDTNLKYPHLKKLIIECAAVKEYFDTILDEFVEMFPNLEVLQIVATNQSGEYDDDGQEELTRKLAVVTKKAEKVLKELVEEKPNLKVDIEIIGRTPSTDGYEMQPSDFREARDRFAKVGFTEIIESCKQDSDDDELDGTWSIDFIKDYKPSENKRLYSKYHMFTMVYEW